MGDFRSDLLGEVANRGKYDLADAIGMPDAQDYEVLLKIIQKFEAKHPGLIAEKLAAGRADYEAGIHRGKRTWTGKATVNKSSNMVYVFELPDDLYYAIEAVFPSMFRSKKHFTWFKKNFYKLTITGESTT
jgi:hypothetical protein